MGNSGKEINKKSADDIMREQIEMLKREIALESRKSAEDEPEPERKEAKSEEPKDEPKPEQDEVKPEEPKHEPKPEQEAAKSEEPKEEPKPEQEAAKSEEPKTEEPEEAKSEEPKDGPKPEQEEPKPKEPKGESKPEESKQEEPKHQEPKAESKAEPKEPSPDELEPATVHESNPEIVDGLSENLEKQLDHLVGYPSQDVSMDAKIDNAIAKIIDETVGDIPEKKAASSATAATVDAGADKEEKKRRKAEARAARKAEKAEERAERKAERVMDADSEEYQKKKKTRKVVLSVLAGVVLLAGIGTYGGFAYYYRDIFFHDTMINGFDCSEMTVAQAESLIRKQVEDYSIRLDFRDGTSETIAGTDIDYKYVSDGSVQRILDEQNPLAWIKGYFSPEEYEVARDIQYSQDKLREKYQAMPSVSDESQVAPTDAYVAYDGAQFSIIPETAGNQFDRETLLARVNEAVSGSHTEINAEEQEIYAVPSVYSSDPKLSTEAAQLNELANVNITYVLPQGNKVLDGNEVRTWLDVDEAGNYSISEEELGQHIKDYVGQLAEETNTLGGDKIFRSTMQGDVTVSGGSYGWKIDKKTEIAQLTEDIQNHTVTTREPAYSSREFTTENNGFGDTYIEIDMGNQHLWYYINGDLFLSTDIVTGTGTNPKRRTPEGVYTLTYKQRNRVLKGEIQADGKPEYEQPVSYWMPFNGGIGLHDANWKSRFGGTVYRYNGSHGCINLPPAKAAKMYEKIDKETPIVCFY